MLANPILCSLRRTARSAAVALSPWLVLLPTAGQAATVNFAVGGPNSGSEVLGDGNSPGFAQSFTMTETLSAASLSIDLFCTPSCTASLYLINGLPNALAGVAQYETDRTFSGAGNFTFSLTGRLLNAGTTYTLILSMLQGNGLWRSTTAPQISGTSATVEKGLLMTNLDPGYPALSDFTATSGITAKFSITGQSDDAPAPVPLPATLPLLLMALAILMRRRFT